MAGKKTATGFAEQLRAAIDGSGLSRYEICKRTGIHQSHLSRFMAGTAGLGSDKLQLLFSCLGLVVTAKGGEHTTKMARGKKVKTPVDEWYEEHAPDATAAELETANAMFVSALAGSVTAQQALLKMLGPERWVEALALRQRSPATDAPEAADTLPVGKFRLVGG